MHVILVIQLIRSSGVKAVKGLCAPFVITKFIVSVYLNFTNSGPVEKRGFWVPKIICDAYDGENIWLSSNEDEIHDRFLYGEEPSESFQSGSPVDRIRIVKEIITGTPTDPADSSERYKNMRDLK